MEGVGPETRLGCWRVLSAARNRRMTSPPPQPGLPVKCLQLDSAHSPKRAERGARQRPEGVGGAVFGGVGQPQQDVAKDVVDEEVFSPTMVMCHSQTGDSKLRETARRKSSTGRGASCC